MEILSEISTLTIQPWPIVKPNENIGVHDRVIDKVTLPSISDEEISFLFESASPSIPVEPRTTDSTGNFTANLEATEGQGAVSITAVFYETILHHAAASPPALAM